MHAEPPAADGVTSNDTPDLPLPAPRVLLVVLTWNGRDDTLACVESILALDYPRFRVLVVDNASTDGTEAALRERFGTRIDILRNDANLLYGGGMNVGRMHSRKRGRNHRDDSGLRPADHDLFGFPALIQ